MHIAREPLYVPRNMRLERLFDIFKERKIHMAIVVNEYGKFSGLITMEDLLEELFGEIRDEKELPALTGEYRFATPPDEEPRP